MKLASRSLSGIALLTMTLSMTIGSAPQVQTALDPGEQGRLPSAATQADHRRILDLLGIASIPGGPSMLDPNAYDEASANPYPSLPDPLRFRNGEPVRSASAWRIRRAEILEDFDREVYGRVPAATPRVAWEVLSTTSRGASITKQLVGRVDNSTFPALKVDIRASLIVPANARKPVPVIVHFTGSGSGGLVRRQYGPPAVEQLLSRGWGYFTLDADSIQSSSGGGLTSGIIGLVNKGQPRKLDDWGVLSAWAWGASRALDYLESDKAVNADQVGVAGLLRLGAAAMLAMARDERFAIGFISSSGAGGVKLLRRNSGETVNNLATVSEYQLLAGNFLKYAGHWNDLPVDAHELIAMAAPRPVFIGAGGDVRLKPFALMDGWQDPRGMFMAAVAAGPVYRLLGKKDLGTQVMPPMLTWPGPGDIAFRQHRSAPTDFMDWESFLNFAERFINPYSVRPVTFGNMRTIVFTVKKRGSLSPLAGKWTWTAPTWAEGKPREITLKIEIKGNGFTGKWSEPVSRSSDRIDPLPDFGNGVVVDAATIRFQRCQGDFLMFDPDFGTRMDSQYTFIKCVRDRSGQLKRGMIVVEYTGRLDGDNLMVTEKGGRW